MKKLQSLLVIMTLVFIYISNGQMMGQEIDQELVGPDELEFIRLQQSPLENSQEELFLLNKTIWQRLYGEKEFYLAPTLTDIKAYYDRIKMYDDKDLGIIKSKLQFIRIEASSTSREILSNVNIILPDYVQNSVLILIPEIDVDYLERYGLQLKVDKNYGYIKFTLPQLRNPAEIIWYEDFEGSFPGSEYTVGDAEPSCGEDYWDDLNCESHTGDWSIWCSDIGGEPDCVSHDCGMWAYVWKTSGIYVGGHSNVQFEFWTKYNTEVNYDYLQLYYSSDGSNWTPSDIFIGNSGGWTQHQYNVNNFQTFYWQFVYISDGSINLEGAYLDNLILAGDVGLPDLVVWDASIPTSAFPGEQINISCTIKNIGQGVAGSSRVGYFLATSNGGTDDYLGDDYVTSLAPGETSSESETVTIPTNTPPGNSYFITFFADYQEGVPELDENNNKSSLSIEITIPPPTYSINDISWLDEIDQDGDGYTRSRTIRANITTSQTTNVKVELWVEPNGGTNSLYYVSPNFSLSQGTTNVDIEGVGTVQHGGELDHDIYDWSYFLHDISGTLLAYMLTPDDADLNNENFETALEDTPKPIPPSDLVATAVSSSQINLNWTDNSNNEDGFKIERKTGSGGTWSEITTVGINVTSYNNTNLNSDTEYCYRVRAFNATGNSDYSNENCASTNQLAPNSPSNLIVVQVSNTQINLSWTDNSNNEDEFKIERKTVPGGTWSQIDSVAVDTTNYADEEFNLNTEYCYRVRAFNSAGYSGYTNDACVITTGVIGMISTIPKEYNLKQNYPNPFNPSTDIEFSLKEESYTTLTVFDITGKEVKSLFNNESLPTGTYRLNFDASDLPSGIYFYRIQAGNFIETKKMILLK